MKKALFILILSFLLFNCEKEDDLSIDYTPYLVEKTPSFIGVIDGNPFQWRFSWNNYQMSSGYENGQPIYDPLDNDKVLFFGLIAEYGTNYFQITTPKFNSLSKDNYDALLNIGQKNLGDLYSNFHLQIQVNDQVYNSDNINTEIEVLKTEEIKNELGEDSILVWIKFESITLNSPDKNNNIVLSEGLMIARFYGYVF